MPKKYTYTLILIVINLLINSQVNSQTTIKNKSKNNLKEQLWNRIQSITEYTDSNSIGGMEDLITVIDDTKNGYLKVSGEFPPCGCLTSETVAAFKDINGNYTLLEEETNACNWKYSILSNKKIATILPADFGIENFIPAIKQDTTKQALFFLTFDIPRYGTATKVTLELIPLGMSIKSDTPLVYHISQEVKNTTLKELKKMHQLVLSLSDEGIDLISKGKNKILSNNNLKVLNHYQQNYKENSLEFFRNHLKHLKRIYNLYRQIKYKSILLKWDKTTAKFYIKEKEKSVKKMSFHQFVRSSLLRYWSANC